MSNATVSSLDEVHILLVEDNEIDVMAFERGLKKNSIANPMTVAENGMEALQVLRGEHPTKSVGSHRMVFLDLNMPIMNGVEFLEEVRRDPELSSTLVFVLTTSDHEMDLVAAYKKNVAGYILKSRVGEACKNLHDLMRTYWQIVVIP
ncbi:response regulator [Rhodopirellula halodulae]|uniref:response regulator n=1 Tax=Rhodopirellula halodulae TaxID=2894198 RepID=UPI001E435D46|nr:response regulator [Rhodopirellula sp. JC737]MCC9657612.1 response regulator [Rhodopirellula sp. JC737]